MSRVIVMELDLAWARRRQAVIVTRSKNSIRPCRQLDAAPARPSVHTARGASSAKPSRSRVDITHGGRSPHRRRRVSPAVALAQRTTVTDFPRQLRQAMLVPAHVGHHHFRFLPQADRRRSIRPEGAVRPSGARREQNNSQRASRCFSLSTAEFELSLIIATKTRAHVIPQGKYRCSDVVGSSSGSAGVGAAGVEWKHICADSRK